MGKRNNRARHYRESRRDSDIRVNQTLTEMTLSATELTTIVFILESVQEQDVEIKYVSGKEIANLWAKLAAVDEKATDKVRDMVDDIRRGEGGEWER